MKHGIDCPCDECERIRQLLSGAETSGDIHLVGLEKDKAKIRVYKAGYNPKEEK